MTARSLAERALAVDWDGLPDEARHAARLSLADGLAVMTAATALEPACAPFADHVRAPDGARLFSGGRAGAAGAAFANGALAHAIDFEDTFDPAGLHPHAAAIPALLALGETEGARIGECLAALAVAADFACRIGLCLPQDPAGRGWYHPPMIGAIGAALGAAHLLQLDAGQTVAALSLVQVQFALTGALKTSPASHLRAVRDGFAARAAVEAALLARAGVIANREPVDELVTMLAGERPRAEAFEGYGTAFLGPEVSLKAWPCCRGTHGAIALGLSLRDQGVVPGEIARAAFTVAPPDDMLFTPLADRQRPTTAIGAKFSIPFAFASAVVHGPPGLAAFGDAARRDETVRALAGRVYMAQCGAGAQASAVVEMTDARTLTLRLPDPPRLRAGSTRFATVDGKFADCLASAGRRERLADLLALETLPREVPVAEVARRLV